MAEDTAAQERTEPATPKRRQEAKHKGDVARSRDLATVLLLMSSAGIWLFSGRDLVEGLSGLMRRFFSIEPALLLDPQAMPVLLAGAAIQMIQILAPFFALMLAVAVLAPLCLGGWVFSSELLTLKWDRLNPLQGLKRLFGIKGLVELLKALAKFGVIAGVAMLWLDSQLAGVLTLDAGGPVVGLARAASLIGRSFLVLSAATLLIAAIDVPYQIWENRRRLKMTRQEIRDEFKDSEGKPEVKSRIRRLQQELARRRMMQDVAKADVIVTNPSHYAVALRYDPDAMPAPKVVGKGANEVAARMREIGIRHQIALVEAPPLARALFHSTRINHEIPAGLYLAVAQVLAYVFQLRQKVPGVQPPRTLDIPSELAREA